MKTIATCTLEACAYMYICIKGFLMWTKKLCIFLVLSIFVRVADINIQQCITDALRLYQSTPPSLCLRSQQSDNAQHPDIPPEAVRTMYMYMYIWLIYSY